MWADAEVDDGSLAGPRMRRLGCCNEKELAPITELDIKYCADSVVCVVSDKSVMDSAVSDASEYSVSIDVPATRSGCNEW